MDGKDFHEEFHEMKDSINQNPDAVSLLNSIIILVTKTTPHPVHIRTSYCETQYAADGCGPECESYKGCDLVRKILSWTVAVKQANEAVPSRGIMDELFRSAAYHAGVKEILKGGHPVDAGLFRKDK